MSEVICKVPKTGLGNQLFPLVKAHVFASLNRLPVKVTGYDQLKIGPYLRGEKSKRNYSGYFTFQKSIAGALWESFDLLKYGKYELVNEPALGEIPISGKKKLFIFRAIPHWSDYFAGLKDHRELAIQLFHSILSASIAEKVKACKTPCIGIHVRMGDYRKLQQGEDFSKLGVVRTPIAYFADVIQQIRTVYGSALPVSIFTDGYAHEISHLLSLDNVHLVEGNPDIVDMILLSKSQIIVTSAGSTFSYWAGFLSNAVLIMHPDHIHQSIRPEWMAQRVYEGACKPGDPLLRDNILHCSP